MKARAGQGIDQMSPVDIQRLPDVGVEQLTSLFEACESQMTWPWQVLMILGRLLAKKSGGDRVIGLLTMLTRVWSLAREEDVRSWSSSSEPAWDAAVQGNAALREAFLRALHDEAYFKLGIENGHGLLDVQGFYDSIGWAVLVRTALRLISPRRS